MGLLKEAPPAINSCHGSHGDTLLHLVASYGDVATLKSLLTMGADRTIANKQGKTAAQVALQHHHPEASEVLESWTPPPAAHPIEEVKQPQLQEESDLNSRPSQEDFTHKPL